MISDLDKSVLENEIEKVRRTIKTDSYPMSIRELTNLYREAYS